MKPGMATFDFSEVRISVFHGAFKSYLDDRAWGLLAENGVTVDDVKNALLRVLDAKALRFFSDEPIAVQVAQVNFILDGLRIVEAPAEEQERVPSAIFDSAKLAQALRGEDCEVVVQMLGGAAREGSAKDVQASLNAVWNLAVKTAAS